MIECPHCGKKHRTEDAVAKCQERQARKAARERKRIDDQERRIHNWITCPPEQRISDLRAQGKNLDGIVTSMNKDYPPPQGGLDPRKWTIWEVAGTIAETLPWPGYDIERKTELIIERHFLGDFVTGHPLWHFIVPEGAEMVGELLKRDELTREGERNGVPSGRP